MTQVVKRGLDFGFRKHGTKLTASYELWDFRQVT